MGLEAKGHICMFGRHHFMSLTPSDQVLNNKINSLTKWGGITPFKPFKLQKEIHCNRGERNYIFYNELSRIWKIFITISCSLLQILLFVNLRSYLSEKTSGQATYPYFSNNKMEKKNWIQDNQC